MNLSDYIKPSNNQHSIKEAVITVFLSNPIEDPQSFKGLQEAEFKGIFNTFNIRNEVKVHIKPDNVESVSDFSRKENRGFTFIQEDESGIRQVLQGVNEEDRTFLSFHTLDYSRWQLFFDLYLSCIKPIAQKHAEFQIEAFSLHYIDEFTWIFDDNPDLERIFKKNNNYLPISFFEKSFPKIILSFTTNPSEQNDTVYTDQLNISVIPTMQPTIQISHNSTYQFSQPIDINHLLSQDIFQEKIFQAHYHNKDVLNDLLTDEIRNQISLTQSPNQLQ